MTIETHLLTTDRWDDFQRLFGPSGAAWGCWCMWWFRTGKEMDEYAGEPNRLAIRARVVAGSNPGILAYVDGRPAGWCAIGPRSEYPRLGRSRILKPIDETPVWSIVCLFVDKEFRAKGLTAALIEAAVDFAADNGATIIEGYPVDTPAEGRANAMNAFVGTSAMFQRAGFAEVARGSRTRTTVRKELR